MRQVALITADEPTVCLSESPHPQNGKHDEAWMILKQVHDTNMRAKGYPERVFSVSPTFTVHVDVTVTINTSMKVGSLV